MPAPLCPLLLLKVWKELLEQLHIHMLAQMLERKKQNASLVYMNDTWFTETHILNCLGFVRWNDKKILNEERLQKDATVN